MAYQESVEPRLSQLLPPADREPVVLHEAMRSSALAPGKRLRPALCMAACAAAGGDPLNALDAGCALEFVHCFSLIHDDLPAIDNDDLRRGLPTCHKVYGEAAAILAGDALFALAFSVVAQMQATDAQKARCTLLLANSSGSDGLVAGEVLDVLAEGQEPDLEKVRSIHRLKTGALIQAACEMGGVMAGASDQAVAQLGAYGRDVGLAFQIADDVLNETSTAEELGKAVGSDAERGKQTYPRAIGLEAAIQEAARCAEAAKAALEGLPGDASALRDLAEFSARRTV